MPKLAIVTIVTRNYGHFAKVVLESARKYHPEAATFVCFADAPPDEWLASINWASTMLGRDLSIEEWLRFAFQYTPFELACSLKPHVIDRLLDLGFDEIVYVDADMELFGPLVEVTDGLRKHSIILTPHLHRPLPLDEKRPTESAFLSSGAYNAGFIAVRADENSRQFISWWKSMVKKQCIVDMAGSLFVDQKWLGLVPGLFEGVLHLKHPGYNAGHWSLSQFHFSEATASHVSDSRVDLDGYPLVLFHYSGMTPENPDEYLREQTRTSLERIPGLQRLVTTYHEKLRRAGLAECTSWKCEFDRLEDGTQIHPAWRESIRRDDKTLRELSNPFELSRYPNLMAHCPDIERRAVRWRRDWLISWPKQRGFGGVVRGAIKSVKASLQKYQRGRRAA